MKPFEQAMEWLAEYEGGFSNRPLSHDPGGPTNRGITQHTYTSWLKASGKPNRAVINLTEHEYDSIYSMNYWRPLYSLEKFPAVRMCVFDAAVHSGPGRAIKLLQRALGVKPDGIIGPITLGEIDDDTIRDYCNERRRFVRSLKNYRHNKNGWENRIDKVESRCNKYRIGTRWEKTDTPVIPTVDDAVGTPAMEKERTAPIQTSTMKAALTTAVSSGGGMLTAIAALDGTVQLALVGVFGVGLMGALWVYRERMLKWDDGDR